MANSEEIGGLARVLPAAYLAKSSDAWYVAAAALESDWMREHERDLIRMLIGWMADEFMISPDDARQTLRHFNADQP